MIRKYFFLIILFIISSSHHQELNCKLSVLFSPYDKPTTYLINLIKQAKKSIYAATYMITDKEIAQALIQAHERGVDVRIITDIVSTGKYGKADLLAENGICVYILDANSSQNEDFKKQQDISKNESCTKNYNDSQSKSSTEERWFLNDPIMHHKFVIIDKSLVWTGSFNWTVAANRKNHENIITVTDKEICKSFFNHFNKMMTDGSCKPYYPGRILTYMPSSLAGKILAAINQIKEEKVLKEELLSIIDKHDLCTIKA